MGTKNSVHAPTHPQTWSLHARPSAHSPHNAPPGVRSCGRLELGQVTPATLRCRETTGLLHRGHGHRGHGHRGQPLGSFQRNVPSHPALCGAGRLGRPASPGSAPGGTIDIRVIPERRLVTSSHVAMACSCMTTPSLPLTLQYVCARVHVCTSMFVCAGTRVCVWDARTHMHLCIYNCIALCTCAYVGSHTYMVHVCTCVLHTCACAHYTCVHMAMCQVCMCMYMCVCVLAHTSHHVRWSEADSYQVP